MRSYEKEMEMGGQTMTMTRGREDSLIICIVSMIIIQIMKVIAMVEIEYLSSLALPKPLLHLLL